MDKRIFEILEYLEPSGVSTKVDISSILNKLFPVPKQADVYSFGQEQGNLLRFLEALKPWLNFADPVLPQWNANAEFWFNNFKVSLTPSGLEALEKEKSRQYQNLLTLTTLETNKSILATNDSVQRNNSFMAGLADRQLQYNEIMASNAATQTNIVREQRGFSEKQTSLIRRQTWIFFFTALFSLGSLWFIYRDDIRETQKDNSKNIIDEQATIIQSLRNQLKATQDSLYKKQTSQLKKTHIITLKRVK